MSDWSRVKLVLEGAFALADEDLQAYLAEACGSDRDLRLQVETLLAARHEAATFLETPGAVLLDYPAGREDLSGRVVTSYKLLSRLGSGGMGEVYLAHDAKLDRPVALKFLSPKLSADGDKLRRFHQEARAASSLNHPHIVVVHDFGELDGRPYMVTEYVEGETLRARLANGPMAPADVLGIAEQIASALAAAHSRGLVHRDIKPENVMVRPDGYVKVLDFGLAKFTISDRPAHHPDTERTQPGMVMGTPRYMSPEQARGLDVDARSDVWSFGVVLYEMIARRPPFMGATLADEIAAILGDDPAPLDSYASNTPPPLRAIVAKALQKNPADRHASADEILVTLRGIAPVGASPASASSDQNETDEEGTLAAAGERRRATVLISTVSGYDSLVERLAPSAIEQTIALVRAAAIDIVRQHGGIVNQSIGEEIVSVFGIPTAHEDDDLRAVRAACELHARTREISGPTGSSGFELRLQSGVHAGSVVAQRLREGPRRYAVTGTPVQTAARLAAAAEPDAILVSPECHRRVAPFVRTELRAPVPVQSGLPPITPHSVLGESGLESRLDAPEHGALTPYTGRAEELNVLRAQVASASRGEGRLVLAVGEAGSGKSRMLHELRANVGAAAFRILQGRCRSYGGLTSYLPFVEALLEALEMKDPDRGKPPVAQIVARIRGIEASLEPFLPLYLHLLSMQSDAFALPRHLRGEHLQAAMLEALAAFFTSFAQRTPCLLLLEDWHWADDASRQALKHVGEVVSASPMLIVVTTRPEAGTLFGAADHVVRINLGPLDFASSLAIMKAVLAVEEIPESLACQLHERTGGNPFFLEEMCQALGEAGVVTAHGTAAVVQAAGPLQLPDSVQAVIRARLDRLHPDGRDVLRVASVIGREFSRRTLRVAMGADDLTESLERLKNAGIIQQIRVVPDPLYRFKHVLTQEVTYESLLEHQRKALHLAVGRAITGAQDEGFDERLEVLAHHFSRAEAWAEAIEYGLRAAARATELSQFADGLSMLERVHSWLLRLPDEPLKRDRIADVLLKQERLCETLGMRRRQLELGEELIALLAPHGASERLAEAYLRQGDVSTLLKRFDAADRALTTALRMSRERGDAALERNALRSIGLLRWHQGRHAEAADITETALAIDRQRQDEMAVAGDLANLANTLRSMGEYRRALVVLEEALSMQAVANDPIKQSYILHNIAQAHRSLGDVGRALEYLQIADDSARAQMLPIQRSFHLTSIAHIHLQQGRVAESLRVYQEAVEFSRRARHADGLAQTLRMLGEVLFGLGRDQEALGALQEAAQLFAQIEDREAEAAMLHHVAVVLARSTHPDALGAWQRVLALARTAGDAGGELDALEGIARASRTAGAPTDTVVQAFEQALALASRLGERRRETDLRNTLGILHWERGAYVEALAQYEALLALIRVLGDRVHEGLVLNSIGVTLTRLRRYEEARTPLEDALTINRETGERLLEAHTLAALGEVARALGRFDAAVQHLQSSLAIRREIEDRRGEGWMLHQLALTLALMGDETGSKAAAAEAARIAAECGDAALRRACGSGVADAPSAAQSQKE